MEIKNTAISRISIALFLYYSPRARKAFFDLLFVVEWQD